MSGVAGYSAPDPTGSAQEVLEHSQFQYDVGDNPTQIDDLRNPFAWADGQKPVTRTIGYDGYNRATAVNYTYATASGDDLHESPNLAEHTNGLGADKRGKPQPEVAFDTRVRSETYAYDGLGNRTNSGDDQNGFYDRSLGVEAHDAARPYQLTSALIGVGTHQGSLTASYDAAGNQTGLSVLRDAASCMPIGANCNQRYAYEWDEYNRLTRARRWDGANLGTANDPLPETAAAADLVYAYNGADSRTRTTVVHPGVADDVHTLYIYASLELRRTGFDGENNDYLLDATHERVYLGANGERLAQLRPDEAGLPAYTGEARVFFEFADHLGSANTVVDKRTGELVEKRTYTAYGSIESDHRQDRWGQFREDYGFTTKEEDVEVGLTYFGKRFYNPRLGRWLNADPLAIHSPGEADLNLYAYVSGRVFATVDPLGLKGVAGSADNPIDVQSPKGLNLKDGTIFVFNPVAKHSSSITTFRGHGDAIANGYNLFFRVSSAAPVFSADFVAKQLTRDVAEMFNKNHEGEKSTFADAAEKATHFEAKAEEGGKSGGVAEGGCASCEGSQVAQAASIALRVKEAVDFVEGAVEAAVTAAERTASKVAAKPAGKTAYSVAFQMHLPADQLGTPRANHFKLANEALEGTKELVPELAALVPKASKPSISPKGWIWQHATIEQGGGYVGVMQLVPELQHTPGSEWWRTLHPLKWGGGGYTQWAIPLGAPKNK